MYEDGDWVKKNPHEIISLTLVFWNRWVWVHSSHFPVVSRSCPCTLSICSFACSLLIKISSSLLVGSSSHRSGPQHLLQKPWMLYLIVIVSTINSDFIMSEPISPRPVGSQLSYLRHCFLNRPQCSSNCKWCISVSLEVCLPWKYARFLTYLAFWCSTLSSKRDGRCADMRTPLVCHLDLEGFHFLRNWRRKRDLIL